jgi:hypothetical protein
MTTRSSGRSLTVKIIALERVVASKQAAGGQKGLAVLPASKAALAALQSAKR